MARYLQHAQRRAGGEEMSPDGMEINLTWEYSDDKTKISTIGVHIILPQANPGRRAGAILEAASRCLLHNTIESRHKVTFTLKEN